MARILVVDDDKDILKMAERVLSHSGHTTLVAEDAIKAMEILDSTSFDMVISDANMPHYSGFELIRTIRSHSHLQDMAIAMLTSLRKRSDVERAIAAGADDYICKPIDPLLLVQKIDSLFTKRPPSVHLEVEFPTDTPMNTAVIFSQVRVRSLSELGVEIELDQQLKPGSTIELNGHFFLQHLGFEPPPCRVLSQIEVSSKSYRTQLVFIGATEFQLKKIRQWMLSHGSMMKKSDNQEAA